MPKPKATLSITLPVWSGKSNKYNWRKAVLQRLRDKREETGAFFEADTKVEIQALVHLQTSRKGADGQDIDNLLKHICDALQARRGGSKSLRRKGRLIQNDHQVFRAVIEKKYLHKKNASGGRLTVRPYKTR